MLTISCRFTDQEKTQEFIWFEDMTIHAYNPSYRPYRHNTAPEIDHNFRPYIQAPEMDHPTSASDRIARCRPYSTSCRHWTNHIQHTRLPREEKYGIKVELNTCLVKYVVTCLNGRLVKCIIIGLNDRLVKCVIFYLNDRLVKCVNT